MVKDKKTKSFIRIIAFTFAFNPDNLKSDNGTEVHPKDCGKIKP